METNVHYRIDESRLFVPILNQIIPVHDQSSDSLKIRFNIFFQYDIIQRHFEMSHASSYSETVFRDVRQYNDRRSSNLQWVGAHAV